MSSAGATAARARARSSRSALATLGEPPVLLLAAAILAAAALLLDQTRNITFLLDDWEFLVYRRGYGTDVLLDPHNEHLVIGPILVYKALLELFGMDSARPFQVASTVAFLTSAALLFAWLRERVDQWLALGASILVLFLGAAWEDLLWSFQIGYFGSMAAGLAMLLGLKRETSGGDRLACAALVVAFAFSSLGISFALGAAVAIGTSPRWRARLYVVAIPLLLYGMWWLGWGHTAETHLSLHNIANAPIYVFDAIGSALSSLFGMQTPRDESGVGAYDWGRPLAVLALALAGWRVYRLGSVPRWLWVVGAIAASFFVLSALNTFASRAPSSSRYQYPGAIFVLLVAAELVRGIRVRPAAMALAGVVGALAVVSGISFLKQSADSYERTSDLIKASLGALEIARETAEPGLVLTEPLAGTGYVGISADVYLSAVDEFGSPADTPEDIAAAPEPARRAADRVLAAALGIAVAPGQADAGASCRAVDPAGKTAIVELPPGGAVVRGARGAHVDLRLRRFSPEVFPISAGDLTGPAAVSLAIPRDRSTVPWELQLAGTGSVSVCAEPPA